MPSWVRARPAEAVTSLTGSSARGTWGDLSRHRLVVLPNVLMMAEEEVQQSANR